MYDFCSLMKEVASILALYSVIILVVSVKFNVNSRLRTVILASRYQKIQNDKP